MAADWSEVGAKVPTSIGGFVITITSFTDNEADYDYSYNLVVLDQGGNDLSRVVGSLADRMTAGQLNQLKLVHSQMRAKATDELLP